MPKKPNSCPSLHRRFFLFPQDWTPLAFPCPFFFRFVSVALLCHNFAAQPTRCATEYTHVTSNRAQWLLCYVLCKNTSNMYELRMFFISFSFHFLRPQTSFPPDDHNHILYRSPPCFPGSWPSISICPTI
ncbi:hypothetical protein M413DRAFT_396538 [Hebeloma cylindrosporum]|uniref:Uncharacterized protein n=1 Tax=Hebeloma cylindrosporum TaxID=76867 RepID=A0A0C3CG54_HEBCY|nr:hypothetical protein M413DRAFT_396538 [Hebeloma cylindrosporum h7]